MAETMTDLRALARAHTEDAIATLVAIMTREDAAPGARITAAIAILDRGWGKPGHPDDEIAGDGRRPISDVAAAELVDRLHHARIRLEAVIEQRRRHRLLKRPDDTGSKLN